MLLLLRLEGCCRCAVVGAGQMAAPGAGAGPPPTLVPHILSPIVAGADYELSPRSLLQSRGKSTTARAIPTTT